MDRILRLIFDKPTLLLLCLIGLFSPSAFSQQSPYFGETAPPELRHLLYVYYTETPLNALIEINSAIEFKPSLKTNTTLALILAELYLKLDYLDKAQSLLLSTSSDSDNEAYKNALFLELAAKHYSGQNFQKSKEILNKVTKNLSRERHEQRQLQKGMTYLALGDFREASKSLDNIASQSIIGAYAQYNLGIALLNRRKFDEGVRALNKLGRSNFIEEELKNLKDRANISLGFLYMRAQEPGLAKTYLERVRLSSTLSNQALLGMGWADIINENYKEALIPLLELHSRPKFDSAVIEAYLAVPHALSKLGSDKHALDYYEQAVTFYEQQIKAISMLTEQFRRMPSTINELLTFSSSHNQPPVNARDALLARISNALISKPIYVTTSNNYLRLAQLRTDIFDWQKTYQNHANAHTLPVAKSTLDLRISKLSKQIGDAIEQHETLLSELVLNELIRENDKLNQYISQARLSMAQIYDKILNQRTAP